MSTSLQPLQKRRLRMKVSDRNWDREAMRVTLTAETGQDVVELQKLRKRYGG